MFNCHKIYIISSLLIIALFISQNNFAQYSCNNPQLIPSLPYNATGLETSIGASYQVSGVCSDNYDEQDYILQYTALVDEVVEIDLVIENEEFGGVYIFNECAQPPSTCLAFEEGNGEIDMSFTAVEGEEYFIFIGTEGTLSFDINIAKEMVEGVAINKSAATQTLDVNGTIRIGNVSTTAYKGTLRWNESTNAFEGFDGTTWSNLLTKEINDLQDGANDSSNLILGYPVTNLGSGENNVFIGLDAGKENSSGNLNTAMGVASSIGVNASNNTSLGAFAGKGNLFGSDNTYIGTNAGNVTSINISKNVMLGKDAGKGGGGQGNVWLGYGAGQKYNQSNSLIIDNNNLTDTLNDQPLIFGDFADDYVLLNRKNRVNTDEIFGLSSPVSQNFSRQGIYINLEEENGNDYNSGKAFFGLANNGNRIAELIINQEGDLLFESGPSSTRLALLQAGGNLIINGASAVKGVAGSWFGNSDQRLKKNIHYMKSEAMLDKLLQMKGVHYEWNDQATGFVRPKGPQIGFVAQDLAKIWPEKIVVGEDGYLLTAYGDYDPVFVEAIRAINNKVEELEMDKAMDQEKIEYLEKVNQDLQIRLISLENRMNQMDNCNPKK